MPKFEVRTNCEYVLIVDAPGADEAIKEAETTFIADWDQAWAPYEAEMLDDDEEEIETD